MIKGNFGISLLLALVFGLFIGSGAVHAGDGVKGSAKADGLSACVAPTPFMRRSHFELIKHQRHITVHEGIRKTDNSLAGCVDCHVRKDKDGAHVSVNSSGEFCAGCHEFTGTTLDCFTCHATKPAGNTE